MKGAKVIWYYITEFQRYSVSNEGDVRNNRTDRVLKQSINRGGVVYVSLHLGGKIHVRSVARLVAMEFLEEPVNEAFDTPLHLDNDPWNNHARNLMWRPRWFCHKYKQQFDGRYGDQGITQIRETGEVLPIWDAVMRYGILYRKIVVAMATDEEDRQQPMFSPYHFDIPDVYTISPKNRRI